MIWRWRLGWYPFTKRLLDILASVSGILVMAPVMVLIGILIKLEDGGPVFFCQTRVGRHGSRFTMLKFRSMDVDSDARVGEFFARNKHARGITFKLDNDPRLTRMGRILRRLSLDELPQLINILKGEMTMVGPRPPLPREVDLYRLADRRRLEVTPGLTCYWQIQGRSNIDFPEQVNLDVKYIEDRGILCDLKILVKTVPAVVLGRGAY